VIWILFFTHSSISQENEIIRFNAIAVFRLDIEFELGKITEEIIISK